MDHATPQRRRHHQVLLLLFLLRLLLAPGSTVAQTTTATSSITIVVRDAEAHPLAGMTVKVFEQRPVGPARQVAALMTDSTGRLTVQRLDPQGAYVVQFHSAAPIIVDGQRVGSLPMQFVDDQNAGREARDPAQVPGFAVQLRGQSAFTQRFVVGGTYADAPLVAAVPMFDLAERDDAPPRPIHPLTGQELTPAEARVLSARIGEPWEVPPTAEPPTFEGTVAEAPGAIQPLERQPVMPGAVVAEPAPGRWHPRFVLVAGLGLLLSVAVLALRRRTGGQPR